MLHQPAGSSQTLDGARHLLKAQVVVFPLRQNPSLRFHLDALKLRLLPQLRLELDGLPSDVLLLRCQLLQKKTRGCDNV